MIALQRQIDRLLALGYGEAQRRRSSVARLDALLDATIALCDLFPPDLSQAQFYLSEVNLTQDGVALDSSLAPFDTSTLGPILRAFGANTAIELSAGVILAIPQSAARLADPLRSYWEEAISHFHLFETGAKANHAALEGAPHFDSETQHDDFLRNLRYVFDTVVAGDDSRTYTLQVERTRSFTFGVPGGTAVDYAIGYWLPSRRLYDLRTRSHDPFEAPDIAELETLLRQIGRASCRERV